MNTRKIANDIERLNFENLLWIIFAGLSLLNILGDYNEEKYLKTSNNKFKNDSNIIFEFTLIVTFFIYIYFFSRNYKALENASLEDKKLYEIKLLGSSLLIAGIICLIYFQTKQSNFVGAPSL